MWEGGHEGGIGGYGSTVLIDCPHCVHLARMQGMPERGTEDEGVAARVPRKTVGARVKIDVDYPLLRASLGGDVELMIARLETVSANGSADVQATLVRPIHAAATRSDASALRVLLKHGASVECCDPSGFTALHVACHHSATSCIIELVRAGCGDRCAGGCGPGVGFQNSQG